jgi:hypothetical protein
VACCWRKGAATPIRQALVRQVPGTLSIIAIARAMGTMRGSDSFVALSPLVAVVNFQVSILKILAGYPNRLATLGALKRDLALLATSGRDWADMTDRFAAAFPHLDIFTLGFVERYAFGWRLTQKGLMALEMMEVYARAAPIGRPESVARPAEQIQAEPPLILDLAVGDDGLSRLSTMFSSSNMPPPTPAERRSRFAVIRGGKGV